MNRRLEQQAAVFLYSVAIQHGVAYKIGDIVGIELFHEIGTMCIYRIGTEE